MENPKNNYFMKLALMQANKVVGNTKMNPAVGCLLVKNNNVISADSTSVNGRPHAEHNVLKKIKKKDKNIHLYSTLEPCAHYGRTAPCVNKIINKRIKKVFFSIKDPDVRSYNKCSKILKRRKIKVSSNVLSYDVNKFYKSYIKYKKEDLPFLTCKLAISKDFYINNTRSKNITNKFSRGRGHLLRSNHDCILSSSSTVINDNSKLTCRIPGLERFSPARVVLDRNLKIPINHDLILLAKKYPTIILYNKIRKTKIKLLKKNNIKLIKTSLDLNGLFNLKKILKILKKLGFSRILLEAGLKLTTNFLKLNLVDDLYLFISNKKIKSNGKNNIKNFFKLYLKNKKPENLIVNLFEDKLIKYTIK